MKSNKGFTLIELVIVIIVLGILSATAIPKFINISSDAKVATLKAIQGAFESTDAMVISRAAIDGLSFSEEEQTLEGTDINIKFGHLQMTADNITNAMSVSGVALNDLSALSNGAEAVYVHFGSEKDSLSFIQSQGQACYLFITAMHTDDSTGKPVYAGKVNYELQDYGC